MPERPSLKRVLRSTKEAFLQREGVTPLFRYMPLLLAPTFFVYGIKDVFVLKSL